jgi:hypothetical protein
MRSYSHAQVNPEVLQTYERPGYFHEFDDPAAWGNLGMYLGDHHTCGAYVDGYGGVLLNDGLLGEPQFPAQRGGAHFLGQDPFSVTDTTTTDSSGTTTYYGASDGTTTPVDTSSIPPPPAAASSGGGWLASILGAASSVAGAVATTAQAVAPAFTTPGATVAQAALAVQQSSRLAALNATRAAQGLPPYTLAQYASLYPAAPTSALGGSTMYVVAGLGAVALFMLTKKKG